MGLNSGRRPCLAKDSVLVTFFASNGMARRGKYLPLCALLSAEMIRVVWYVGFDRKFEDQHSHRRAMLQEGPKNLNQGSLANWAKMAGSWFAVCFTLDWNAWKKGDNHRFRQANL